MKTLKMIALFEGEEVVVGRCHPGEARILQKKGLADWKEGKVVFKDIPLWASKPGDEVVSGVLKMMDSPPPEALPSRHYDFKGLPDADRTEIDPERLLDPAYHHPKTIFCGTAQQWCDQLAARKQAGHELVAFDNPMSRCIGFLDYTEDSCWELGIVHIKGAKDEEFASLGKPETVRELLRTWDGRREIVGSNSIFDNSVDPGEPPADLWEVPEVPFPKTPRHPFSHVSRVPGWGTFHWPAEQDVIEIHDDKGDIMAPPEGSAGWGFFHREGESVARIWCLPQGVVLDIARMIPESVCYVLLERRDVPSMEEAIRIARGFFLRGSARTDPLSPPL